MRNFALFTALVLSGGWSATAQEAGKPTPDQVLKPQSKDRKEAGVTYGRIKEVKAGQKIVIAVDGAPDKTYNLADAQRTITLAEDLAVGDPVKVMENDKKSAKSVQIVRDTRPDANKGDQQRSRSKNEK